MGISGKKLHRESKDVGVFMGMSGKILHGE